MGDGGGTAVPAKNRAGLGGEDEVGGLAVAVGEEEAGGIAVIDLTGWASGDGDGQRVDCGCSGVERGEVGAVIGDPERAGGGRANAPNVDQEGVRQIGSCAGLIRDQIMLYVGVGRSLR